MIYAILKKVFYLLYFVSLATADCSLHINGEAIIEKTFGFNRVFLKKQNDYISLYNGEKIKAFCETTFQHSDEYLEDKIEIICDGTYLYYRGQRWDSYYGNNQLHCDRASRVELYESAKKLVKCEEHTSLAIGATALNSTSSIYAGICYDWNTKDIKYVNFLAYKIKNMIYSIAPAESDLKFNNVSMDVKIIYYKSNFDFMSREQFDLSYRSLQEKNTLLKNFDFDYSNLMQDGPLQDVFEKYDDILSIIWWRNLRLINWRTFLDLLEERSKRVKYNAIIGTSGLVHIPNGTSGCKTNNTLEIVTDKMFRKTAPLYIWTHLKAITGNFTDDFVVIAYNSPYFTYDPSNIICEDICETIDWMRAFGTKRLMPTMGFIICCRPVDVAHKLDNFPYTANVAVAKDTKEDAFNSWAPINTTPNTAQNFVDDYEN